MDLSSLDWIEYIPEFGGERQRWQDGLEPNPMTIELRTPSYGYVRTLAGRDTQTLEQRAALDKGFLVAHARAVKNCTLDGTPLTTMAELWRAGVEENRLDAELFVELFRALESKGRLRAGARAGLSGPSGSA